jgi:hypothetical protein
MAIARLSAKVGKAGKAAPHADYIAREGAYARRLDKGEALEATESGNMPRWAETNPGEFWRSADAHERANGTTYREFELALPRELPPEDRAALVRDFVKQELGERHAYTWAIHRPKAADGLDQPHAHLMFSERRRDGIDRDPDQYFKRYNAKAPERGGARKGYGERPGQTLTAAERKAELRDLRGRWASLTNAHLERAGVDARIDMRSYRERGIEDRAPERKQLPSAWRDPAQRAAVLEFRQSHREREEAAADLRRLVPDPGADLAQHTKALAERDARIAARQELKRQQVAAITAAIERGEAPAPLYAKAPAAIEQPKTPERVYEAPKAPIQIQERPEAPPADPERDYKASLAPIHERARKAAAASLKALRQERQQLTQARQAHQEVKPWTPIGRGKWEAAGVTLDATGRDLDQREGTAVKAADPQAIERAAVAELRRQAPAVVAAAEAARKEREAREQEAHRLAQEKRRAEYEKAQVGKDFNSMAVSRELRMHGYTDDWEKWREMPAELKEKIEKYNRLPKEQRPKALERIAKDPRTVELLGQAREISRSQKQGR